MPRLAIISPDVTKDGLKMNINSMPVRINFEIGSQLVILGIAATVFITIKQYCVH